MTTMPKKLETWTGHHNTTNISQMAKHSESLLRVESKFVASARGGCTQT